MICCLASDMIVSCWSRTDWCRGCKVGREVDGVFNGDGWPAGYTIGDASGVRFAPVSREILGF